MEVTNTFMGLGSSFLSHNYDIESTGRGRGNIVTKDAGLLTNLTSSDICVIWSPNKNPLLASTCIRINLMVVANQLLLLSYTD